MRTLKNDECVLCVTEQQFQTVCKKIKESGVLVFPGFFNYWKNYKQNTCVRINVNCNIIQYSNKQWYVNNGFCLISYKLFMSEDSDWTPKIGDKVWFLSGYELEIIRQELTDKYNNKTDLQWAFKTRSLARIAKNNLLECINKQVHG